MIHLTERKEWQAIAAHHELIANQHMRDLFSRTNNRFDQLSLNAAGLFLDYSRNRLNNDTLPLLIDLAFAVGLPQKINALFHGETVNVTENRPALHTALRDLTPAPILVNGENIKPLIKETRKQLYQFVEQIIQGERRGCTGKKFTDVINIGIGGSCLGPMMCTEALKDFATNPLKCHFISSVDQAHVQDVLNEINLDSSLFIISSKSFTTLETMTNANVILSLVKDQLGENAIKQHFVAITVEAARATRLGIANDHIFPLWDWVGGRYSIWSAIGLPLMLMIGTKQFDEFLAGAHAMDEHFRHADFQQNMPVLLALLSIWYINFFHARVQAISPYSHRLRLLVPYLQQADMESNGKNTGLLGEALSHATGPVIFGGEGCNGQHSYHQLLHQGQHFIPVDFILTGQSDMLMASGLSQAQALMSGNQINPGNRPSNIIFLEQLTPSRLGALLALYEHKIFAQGAIWGINSFDQEGVELGKQLLPNILEQIRQGSHVTSDDAAAGIIRHYKQTQCTTS